MDGNRFSHLATYVVCCCVRATHVPKGAPVVVLSVERTPQVASCMSQRAVRARSLGLGL